MREASFLSYVVVVSMFSLLVLQNCEVRHDVTYNQLQVVCVEETENSAAQEWNSHHPDEAIQQGDYIMGVNGMKTVQSIANECQKKTVQMFTVLRRSAPEVDNKE